MDDNGSEFQITSAARIILPLLLFTLLAAASSAYIYWSDLLPGDTITSARFQRISALMRHHSKVSSLTHKADDAYLTALATGDRELSAQAIDFLNASLGFIFSGYIDNEPYMGQVVPNIRKTITLLETDKRIPQEKSLSEAHRHFKSIFSGLEQIEEKIQADIKDLYSQQQIAKKRWKLFYALIAASAVIGLFLITFLAFRQRLLIKSLRENEHKLKIHIQERRQAEEEKSKLTDQLHQAKKMESIGLMAGGVAHDLNNILSGLVGYPELLLMKLPKDSELRTPVEAIQDSGSRAALIVEDLLTVARGAASIKEENNLTAIVQEYLHSPEFEKLHSLYPEITFTRQLDAEMPWIRCSPVHIKKCIMNLITNATEAVAGAGTVTVSIENRHLDETAETYRDVLEDGDYVFLNVLDTGPGISERDLKHIFDPFYSKKAMGRSGTGLGLTVVWNTMEDHGGKVLVENSARGTCFHLCFPLSQAKKEDQERVDRYEQFAGNGEHILIVDDEKALRDLATQILQTMNYSTDSVASGEQALEFLQESPVDLVVLDMLMAPGINGRQTYEEIIKLYPGQKAIIASGFSESEDVKKTLKMGASQFIKKPYSVRQLSRAIQETLSS
ncbi:MAG: response regulator [Thermodesulfobacteriota bacterium]